MSSVIEKLEREQLRRLPDFKSGDRVRIHLQVVEGSRRRTQVFEGVVIARSGHGVRETVTVRKQSFGVGVERVFPLHSPKIEKIEVAGRGDVRRAKLYYLRERVGRRSRVRERTDLGPEQEIQRELLEGPPPVEEAPEASAEAELDEGAVEATDAEAAAGDEGGQADEASAQATEEGPSDAAADGEAVDEAADEPPADPAADEPPADPAADESPADPAADEPSADPAAESEGSEPDATGDAADQGE